MIYISLVKNLSCIGDIESPKSVLLKDLACFKIGESKTCIENIKNVFDKLLKLFINDLNTNGIDYLKNEFFDLVKKEMIPTKVTTIELRFIKYCTYTKEL